MLDETNDNLPKADGTLEPTAIETPENGTEENVIVLTPEEVQDDALMVEVPFSQTSTNADAEEVEETQSDEDDETEHHEIPTKNYENLSMEELVAELEHLLALNQINKIKTQVKNKKKEFLSQFHHLIDEKRAEFLEQNPETTEQFEYHLPVKSKFDEVYTTYRANKNAHFNFFKNLPSPSLQEITK